VCGNKINIINLDLTALYGWSRGNMGSRVILDAAEKKQFPGADLSAVQRLLTLT
jgi:hypothetical protein